MNSNESELGLLDKSSESGGGKSESVIGDLARAAWTQSNRNPPRHQLATSEQVDGMLYIPPLPEVSANPFQNGPSLPAVVQALSFERLSVDHEPMFMHESSANFGITANIEDVDISSADARRCRPVDPLDIRAESREGVARRGDYELPLYKQLGRLIQALSSPNFEAGRKAANLIDEMCHEHPRFVFELILKTYRQDVWEHGLRHSGQQRRFLESLLNRWIREALSQVLGDHH